MRSRYIVYAIAHVMFCVVCPIVFIFVQYGDTSGGLEYKLPLGAILVVLLLIVIAKNVLLRPRIIKLTAAIGQHEAALKIENDAGKIDRLIAVLKRERTIEVLVNSFVPILVLAALLVGCKALERAAVVLSGAIGFALVSFVVGTTFGVLAGREVWVKHERSSK